jgi:hypothetical protein
MKDISTIHSDTHAEDTDVQVDEAVVGCWLCCKWEDVDEWLEEREAMLKRLLSVSLSVAKVPLLAIGLDERPLAEDETKFGGLCRC